MTSEYPQQLQQRLRHVTATDMKIWRSDTNCTEGQKPGKQWWTLQEGDALNSCMQGQGSMKDSE